jgi:hypothetical protein
MKYVNSDTCRISKLGDTMYLIIGFNRNTKDNTDSFYVNEKDERIDFNYVEEKVVASSKTTKELIESTKLYQRLCGMSFLDYINEYKL